MKRFVMVMPCFNEESRLNVEALASAPFPLLLVDDGSSDRTFEVLEQISRKDTRHRALRLATNVGKGEAVRQGLLEAIAGGAHAVGYLDADLATSLEEAERLRGILDSQSLEVVIGVRWARLGSSIERSSVRHYSGRVFATIASGVLGQAIYDTQCGCKWFGVTPALRAALATPFVSRWAFDVELLGRLLRGNQVHAPVTVDRMLEEPLTRWVDAPGSKVTLRGALAAGADLLRVRRALDLYAQKHES